MNPVVRLRVGHQHSRFWLILARFMGYYSPFWGPGVISIVVDVYVSVINIHSFWPILARFLEYKSLFWGPKVISTIDEPRGVFTCRSLALAVLADSGPFH